MVKFFFLVTLFRAFYDDYEQRKRKQVADVIASVYRLLLSK